MARDIRLNKYRELKNDRRFIVVGAWCGDIKPRFGVWWYSVGWSGKCLGFFDTQEEAVDYCEKLVELEYPIRDDLSKLDQQELKAYAAQH